jgi:hypothetical protein
MRTSATKVKQGARTLQAALSALVGRPLFWACAVALLAGLPLVSGLLRRPPPLLPVLGTLPPFALTEAGGTRLGSGELAGRVWLLGFLDTGCTACAERLGGALERLQYRLRNVGSAVVILEVAVPASPPIVEAERELRVRHANPRLWRTAAGPDARRLLAEVGALSLHQAAMLEAGAALVLVDSTGHVRAIEGVAAPASLDPLVSKLTLLLNSQ